MTLICLIGPTATGKTALAVELVQRLPCEIISVDSAMVYRGMNIGTAKPAPEILAKAPHRLIDIRDPEDTYSVGQFYVDVHRAINEITEQGRIPLLVGGTMLYFYRLEQGLAHLPRANFTVRAQLDKVAKEQGWPHLHQQLQSIDPAAALKIHPQDGKRIQRALEIYRVTGKRMSEHIQGEGTENKFKCLNILLTSSHRALLHERVAQRFKTMLAQGFVEEVQGLMQRGNLTEHTPAMQAVGYRQVWQYLTGRINAEEMESQAVAATRQLVKRQLTWCRKWTSAEIFECDDHDLLARVQEKIKTHIDD